MKTLGMVLVAIGLLALVYGGIDYSRNRTVIKMGSMEVSAAEHRRVPISGAAGVAVLIGGIAFLVLGARRGSRS